MITVKLKNLTLKFCFSFFFILAACSVQPKSLALYSLVFCVMHEIGHLIFMFIFKLGIEEIRFYGGGIKICSQDISAYSAFSKLMIYSGGCLVNIILSLLFICLNMYEPSMINTFLCIFNLLPISYFDGGKILELIFPRAKTARRIASAAAICLLCLLIILSVILSSERYSLSHIFIFIFVLLCVILE